MVIPICDVCQSSLYQENEPIIGAIIVCDHCSSFYQVIQSNPVELQLLGKTGELENPDNEPAEPRS